MPNNAVDTTKSVAGPVVFDGSGTVVSEQSIILLELLSLISHEEERDEFLRTESLELEKFPTAELVVRETPELLWLIPC